MRFRQRMQRFMYGRYGQDELNRFLLIVIIILVVLNMFLQGVAGRVAYYLEMAVLIYEIFRAMSRNIYKRRQENTWFLKRKKAVTGWFRSLKDRWYQRKDFRFFRCPSCRTLLRVPKRKGKILMTCRKCGRRFERKT